MELYTNAVLLVLALSYFSLSAHVYSQWLGGLKVRYWMVYFLILTVVVALGFNVLGVSILGDWPSVVWRIILIGFIFGVIAGLLDRRILKILLRKYRFRQKEISNKRSSTTSLSRSRPQNELGKTIPRQELNVISAVGVGMLEEIIFRGILLEFTLMLPSPFLIILGLIFNVIWFSLSHIEFGWQHIISKVPLGVFALLGTLFFSTVLFAVIVHVTFNLHVYGQRIYNSRLQHAY